ncbi:MAG TPA: 50S ribosomal protein L5 [bacterium]|nr:50S ribosomal protein L5 [bacterium]
MRLRTRYKEQVVPAMMAEFGWTNIHQVPKLQKVVINIGIGEGSKDIKQIENAMEDLAAITGQRPVITRAKKSVAAYKIRTGMPIGTMVTLRGGAMYDFLDKLFNVALPRVRDFQGLPPNAFDTRGNYTMGVREQIVFPEIEYDKVSRIRGMDITIVTSAQDDVAAKRLLELLGMPMRKPRPTKATATATAVAA